MSLCPNGKNPKHSFDFEGLIVKIKKKNIINMFLIPKNKLEKFEPFRCCFVLNEFSAAEFASAIEMLFAAKHVEDIKLVKGFIRHSLDEYKHFSIFTNIKNQISLDHKLNNKEIRFVPNHLFAKGYIYKDKFIFEKKKIKDFAIFIGANEEIAEKKLHDFLENIRNFKPDHAKKIDKILLDEERHAKYSLAFAKKNNSKFTYLIKFSKENVLSKLRHFYANSLNKVSKIFNPILYSLILIMSLPVKFLDLEKSDTDNDVLKNINPKSIL